MPYPSAIPSLTTSTAACHGGDQACAGVQQCYSVASAQRRSRTAEGAISQAAGEDGQQNVSLHLENGVPVYQDMSINMQVGPQQVHCLCLALVFVILLDIFGFLWHIIAQGQASL